jgi:hypothetical protein
LPEGWQTIGRRQQAAGLRRLHLAAGIGIHDDHTLQLEGAWQCGLADRLGAHTHLALRRLGQEDRAIGLPLRPTGRHRRGFIAVVMSRASPSRSEGERDGRGQQACDSFRRVLHAAFPN